MIANYCESAGKARACGDCKFNPINQLGQAKGPTIRPPIKADLRCPIYVQVIAR